ncbi:hypothetical protein PQR53_08445 [Paraburkholderia fungorum]|uniref:hypothetical protein n=1 Tax=Paraburkholderia fungorum TaxID=134537 RepID=UPI0038BE0197
MSLSLSSNVKSIQRVDEADKSVLAALSVTYVDDAGVTRTKKLQEFNTAELAVIGGAALGTLLPGDILNTFANTIGGTVWGSYTGNGQLAAILKAQGAGAVHSAHPTSDTSVLY